MRARLAPAAAGDTASRIVDRGASLPVVGLFLLWLVAAGAYVFVIRPGLPADEPSHWLNVLFYARHWRLPLPGDRGVTYEARQPPLAYAAAALVYVGVHAVTGSLRAGFYGVRLLGALEIGAASWLAWRVAQRAVGANRGPGLAVAAVVVVLNPMLLAMGTSVQNDGLALELALALRMLVVSRWEPGADQWTPPAAGRACSRCAPHHVQRAGKVAGSAYRCLQRPEPATAGYSATERPVCAARLESRLSGEQKPSTRPVTKASYVEFRKGQVSPELNELKQADIVEDDEPTSIGQFRKNGGHGVLLPLPVLRAVDEDDLRGLQRFELALPVRRLPEVADALFELATLEVSLGKDGIRELVPRMNVIRDDVRRRGPHGEREGPQPLEGPHLDYVGRTSCEDQGGQKPVVLSGPGVHP